MIAATCGWCGEKYSARTVRQRFCSKSCAGLYQFRDRPRRPSNWGPRTSVGNAHRKLRAQLLPAALGTPCPLRISPKCTGLMTDPALMQLDHRIARASGGPTTLENCRIVCTPCNQLRGAQLGAQTARRRHGPPHLRHAQTSAPTATRLPRW